ncbi:MAG: hypothetical protein KAW12_00835 [Candidatus Aminicenantes bacterium]|nr:hypothetical protein [Candidatus Aminicenantes bacterium]
MDTEGLLKLLNANNVDYVIIGATAFPVHGYARATLDIDIFVRPELENIKRVKKALMEFGYDLTDISYRDLLNNKLLIRQYIVATDIHPFVKGVTFEETWKNKIVSKFGGTDAFFPALDDIIKMKEAAGRSKDLEDLKFLKRIKELKGKGSVDMTKPDTRSKTKPGSQLKDSREILARAIHEKYVKDQKAKGETPADNPSLVSWEDLPGTLKESNRRQVDLMEEKLKTIGCCIAPAGSLASAPAEFTAEEIESMSIIEHRHWVEERTKNGWKYGPVKDAEKKENPWLIPWEELPEAEKEKDRNPVRRMPVILAKAGFQIFRLTKAGE